jgi:phosphatidylserine/phosphatidylglycerophosphate/cardiolipin synthase-like enzyme
VNNPAECIRDWANLIKAGAALVLIASGSLAAAEIPTGIPFNASPFGAAVAATALGADARDSSMGNRVAMLSGGYDALLSRIHLIRNAKTSIEVQTFIWSNDEAGRLMIYELIEAARRGVKVRIIADNLFSEQDPATVAFVATASPNLEVKLYRPSLARLKSSMLRTMLASVRSFHGVNQRMHNKVMLFDGVVLVTGGRNIENTYFDHSTLMNFRDRDILVVGPAVREAVKSFDHFWEYRYAVDSRELTDVAAEITKGTFRRYDSKQDYDFGGFFEAMDREADDAELIDARFARRLKTVSKAKFISDEPGKSRGFFSKTARITKELRNTLEEAKTSVVVQTPYLVLSNPARRLIRDMQRRHPALRIKISTNSFASTDNLLAYSANYRLRNRYVQELNLHVYEFKPQPASLEALFPRYSEIAKLAAGRIAEGRQTGTPFLCVHAKSMVIDDRVAFIGSYNLDPRSENLNTEVGMLIEDVALAAELRKEIEADMRPENSWVIGRRSLPLGLETVNGLVGGILSLSPIDVWPIQNTSSFELRPGGTEVSPDDPSFHSHYREAGAFPGTEEAFTTKEILTRIYKAVGTPLTPIL